MPGINVQKLFEKALEKVDLIAKRSHSRQGTIHKRRPQKFRMFGPSSLRHCHTHSTYQFSRMLFGQPPPLHSLRTSRVLPARTE